MNKKVKNLVLVTSVISTAIVTCKITKKIIGTKKNAEKMKNINNIDDYSDNDIINFENYSNSDRQYIKLK